MSKQLPFRCDAVPDFDRYEYKTTEGQRKCWDGDPDLTKEGWEEWAEWERFDYTEERYWRRPLNEKQLAEAKRAKADRARTTAKLEKERAVIEAAKSCVHGEEVSGGVNYETGESEPGQMIPPFDPYLCENLHNKVVALDSEEE